MDNVVTANCPGCKAAITVTVGRKSTARTGRCSLCRTVYSYSAWVIKRTEDRTFTQVEFVIDKLGRVPA